MLSGHKMDRMPALPSQEKKNPCCVNNKTNKNDTVTTMIQCGHSVKPMKWFCSHTEESFMHEPDCV